MEISEFGILVDYRYMMIKNTVSKFNIVTLLIMAVVLIYSLINWSRYGKEFVCDIYWHGVQTVESNLDISDVSKVVDNTLTISDEAIAELDSKWGMYSIYERDLSNIDSLITYNVNGQINSAQVIKGDDNWLFFNSEEKGYVDTIADYEGTNSYSDLSLVTIKNNVLQLQDELEHRETQFVLVIPPNKEQIYSEYMPPTYVHSEKSRTDYLIDYLELSGINVVSLKNELLEGHLDNQLYYRYDSHWNLLGGYVGVKTIMDYWNIPYLPLVDRSIDASKLNETYHLGAYDDLATICGLNEYYNDDLEYNVQGTMLIDWSSYGEEQNNDTVSVYINDLPIINKKLLLVGDSYRTSMVPALAEVYEEVYVISRESFSYNIVDEIDPDYLILEYVERYSGELEYLDLN